VNEHLTGRDFLRLTDAIRAFLPSFYWRNLQEEPQEIWLTLLMVHRHEDGTYTVYVS
jgi:hypothetical protein